MVRPPPVELCTAASLLRRLVSLHLRAAAAAPFAAVAAAAPGAAMAAVADRSTPGAMAAVAATIARLDSGAPTLTVSELRVELAKLDVEPQQVEACVERTDLEALLRERAADAEASGRFGAEAWRVAVADLAAATAADAAAAWLIGMEVPVACGCPASPLAVGACVFARERDGHTLQRPQRGIVNGWWCPSAQQPTRRPPTAPEAHTHPCALGCPLGPGGRGGCRGEAALWLALWRLRNVTELAVFDLCRRRAEKWGWRHRFRVDSRTAVTTSDMLQSVYAWELAEVAGPLREGIHPLLDAFTADSASSGGGALTDEVRIADEGDVAATVARACSLTLRSEADRYAAAVLTPNLACVWRRAADAAVIGLARELHWPRVKQLFAGLREPPPAATPAATAATIPAATAAAAAAAAADPAVTATTMPAAAAAVGGGGCWLAVLDRELVLLIAETLVAMDSADAEA